ncbi:MAG TPA: DUF4132 domain-containing protein [Kofleriaceae bacterium]|nr:DUF4132 domain-containing protein [Kofleriaceae bacterium]
MAKTHAPASQAAPRTAPATAVRSPPMIAHAGEAGLGWVDAGRGYQLALDGGKLIARNAQGRRLAAVPKELRAGEAAARLAALRDWLSEHDRACAATVERWMLRSLPVARAVLQAVWDDAGWRRALENAVIAAIGEDGARNAARTGLLRGIDPERGVGIVDLEGETAWLDAERVAIPHPVLLPELDAWRELAMQLGLAQGVPQLHRETYAKPADAAGAAIDRFEDGRFAMLLHAAGRARALGYPVRGGFATCKVWEAGAAVEARYWLGADDAYAEAYTGALSWMDEHGRGLALADVGPVAFSEGMRMASAIYAGRAVGAEEDAP